LGLVGAWLHDGFGGQEDADDGSVGLFGPVAFDGDVAAVFVYDSAADPQAQASAVLALVGEEGLEEPGADLVLDAGAVVADADGCAGLGALADKVCSSLFGGDGDPDLSAASGGLGRVGDEVGEDLAELGGEAVDHDGVRYVGVDGDALVDEAVVHQEEDLAQHLA